jgi:flavin reductase (DIM6/NTAB) family NADH-FMN oxidoreductase RutF
MNMMRIIPSEVPPQKIHQYLLGSIAPRPIAFASTVNAEGLPNLSPFSFFNVFGYNPVTLIFSPSRRGRDNTTKDTYENVKVVPEVVINMVTYEMVNQASLASIEYPTGTDEFVKAGFTKVPSERVRPFRVKESPVQFECEVKQIIETGTGGGAGNLVICEVLVMHVSGEVLDAEGKIDQQKMRLVGRLGRDYYVKAFGDALFEVPKPLTTIGIGLDALPEKIRFSKLLTGNDLGKLGNLEKMPSSEEISSMKSLPEVNNILESSDDPDKELQSLAKEKLERGSAYEALKILMLIKG